MYVVVNYPITAFGLCCWQVRKPRVIRNRSSSNDSDDPDRGTLVISHKSRMDSSEDDSDRESELLSVNHLSPPIRLLNIE